VRAAIALSLIVALGGCLPTVVIRDREAACRIARTMAHQPLSATQLVEITAPFPVANHYARRAYHARMAGIVLTALGAAGIIGAFVTGFALDTSQPAVRTALYADIGGTIGLGAGALLSGWLTLKGSSQAVLELDAAARAECP
jgi:hypothetical protein